MVGQNAHKKKSNNGEGIKLKKWKQEYKAGFYEQVFSK